jgi:hypothetical protein
MYRQFEIPSIDELSVHEQIDVEAVEGEPGAFRVRAELSSGEALELVADPLGRSIRLIVSAPDHRVVDLYREGATRLETREDGRTLIIAIGFQSEELEGDLEVSLGHGVNVKDALWLR